MKLSLAYSPCPNDCFIFDAMVHGKIDTEGLEFEVLLEDVESLNRMALNGQCDITKLSFHAYAYCITHYILLRSGSALGFNCGPLLITRPDVTQIHPEQMKVAIPGKMTTANFLLSLAYPEMKNKAELVFNEIEEAVLSGKVDAGLIIHENRFTYEQKGLVKIRDLGEFWQDLVNAPIPLGGIFMRRTFNDELLQKVNRVIKRSVQFAFDNPESAMPYVRQHAQEMREEVMRQHIQLYVNTFSLDLQEIGSNAIHTLFNTAHTRGVFTLPPDLKLIID